MNVTLDKRTALWAAILLLVFAVGAPGAAMAQGKGRGRGQDKKAGKFKNGHDARDGRWDGRGPRTDRDGRYDDDDDYRYNDGDYRNNDDYRYGRNRRTGNNGGYYGGAEARRQAQRIGYEEGYRAGQDDRASGRGYNLEAHNTYRDATAGYNNSYGDIEAYRNYFREAYRNGYEEGYRNSNGRSGRSRVGTILGDILGRP
ncbi:MAG: hypothetical protein ICV60_16660 [Pyrinomonadaceae bacterium]|nr:hypothetical protein [Pyrinomonadaceae bacterium]